jgi:hypothetical protein
VSCLFKHPILTDEVALQEFETSSELLQFLTEFDCGFSAFASCKLLEDSSVQAFEMSIIVLELAEFNCGISWIVASERFSAFASCKLLEDSSVEALEMSIIVLEFAEFNCRISWIVA